VIIFRYLAKEVMYSMIAVSSVLLLIIMSSRFVKYLAEAAAGKLAPDVLLAIMGYRLPGFLELVLPLGLFIGILMAYGRLYMDSEMTVLSACGMSQRKLLGYTMLPALFLATIVGSLSLYISPVGIEKAEVILKQQKNRSEFDTLRPARFMTSPSGNGVTYSESFSRDRKQMQNVFMAEMGSVKQGQQAELSVILAQDGEQIVDPKTGERYLRLNNGYRYSGRPGDADYEILKFEQYLQHMARPKSLTNGNVKADSIPTRDLLDSTKLENIAALQWRLSLPLLVVVVTLLAVPLSKTDPRQGRYVQMVPAILLYIIYLVSLNAARGALEDGELSPIPGIWPVHIVFIFIAVGLLFADDVKIYFGRKRFVRKESSNA
jgi:lipopolysaccharide export system permease protein